MYLQTKLAWLQSRGIGPYIREIADNVVEYPEGLKIFVLDIICVLEIRWSVLGGGYS
jgi:hypothetical protein